MVYCIYIWLRLGENCLHLLLGELELSESVLGENVLGESELGKNEIGEMLLSLLWVLLQYISTLHNPLWSSTIINSTTLYMSIINTILLWVLSIQ